MCLSIRQRQFQIVIHPQAHLRLAKLCQTRKVPSLEKNDQNSRHNLINFAFVEQNYRASKLYNVYREGRGHFY